MTLLKEVKDIEVRTKRYFLCPECSEHEFVIEHLYEMKPTERGGWKWSCSECGAIVCFSIDTASGGVVGGVAAYERYVRESAVVELMPQNEPVRLIVETSHSIKPEPCCNIDTGKPDTDEQIDDHARYYYEEHTCPINVIRAAQSILVGRDDDAHGLFKFVRRIPRLTHRATGVTGDDALFVDKHAPGLLPPDTESGDT